MNIQDWDVKLEIKDKPFSRPQVLKFKGKRAILELIEHLKEKYNFGD